MANPQTSIYDEPWRVLKALHRVSMQMTGSDNPAIIKKQVKTCRKAMQKRKYQDEAFRVRFPNAVLTSKVEGKVITFTLECNDMKALEDMV